MLVHVASAPSGAHALQLYGDVTSGLHVLGPSKPCGVDKLDPYADGHEGVWGILGSCVLGLRSGFPLVSEQGRMIYSSVAVLHAGRW